MVQRTVASRNDKSARSARERTRRLGWLTEVQAALGWGIILVLIALLGVIYLSQASSIATVGRRVQYLQNDLDRLRRENASLERKIAEAQSLERLQQEAARLGFAPPNPETIEYLIIPDYPVATPSALPAPAPLQPPPETMEEALWLSIRQSVTGLVRGESRDR